MAMPKAYEGNEPYIFISYAHKDSDKVIPIIQALQDRGFRVWYDEGLEVGKSWRDMIEEYLFNCTCAICFITPNFLNSHNCQDEISYAKELEKSPLIVYLDDMQPDRKFQFGYGRFHALKYTDFSGMELFIDKLASTEFILPCRAETPTSGQSPILVDDELERAYKEFEETITTWAAITLFSVTNGGEFHTPETERIFSIARRIKKGATELLAAGIMFYDAAYFSQAVECYRVASEIGNIDATISLAACYFEGKGVEIDYAEGARLCHIGAEHGNQTAQHLLGMIYEMGHGVPQDLTKAIFWYSKADKQNEVLRCQLLQAFNQYKQGGH